MVGIERLYQIKLVTDASDDFNVIVNIVPTGTFDCSDIGLRYAACTSMLILIPMKDFSVPSSVCPH